MRKISPKYAKKVQYQEIFSYNLMYYKAVEQHNPIITLVLEGNLVKFSI